MNPKRIAIICNPYAGSGRDRVFALTRQVFECLRPQVAEILVAPGDMGAAACQGNKTRIIGQDSTRTRLDTIETATQMVREGAELFVIVSGDGTYNDALEGMKACGRTVPILGIAGGRFNTLYPKRKHDPFVSMRGDVRPFSLHDVVVEDVRGIVSRVNGEIVSYGFFWALVWNVVGHTDEKGNLVTIDAAQYIHGKVVPVTAATPVASPETRMVLLSERLGEIELARGSAILLPMVAHVVDEINQVVAAGFGMWAESSGYHGVAYVYDDPRILLVPEPRHFPVTTKALAFYEGDHIRYTNLIDGSVLQVDSTSICTLNRRDVLTVEVRSGLGQKAVIQRFA
jgi:hypothetical protein